MANEPNATVDTPSGSTPPAEYVLDLTKPLVSDGREVRITAEEARAQLQKGITADARLAEATRMRTDAAEKIELATALLAAKAGDRDQWKVVGKHFNMTPEQVDQMLGKTTPTVPAAAPQAAPAYQLPPELQALTAALRERGVDPRAFVEKTTETITKNHESTMDSDVSNALANDPELRYYTKDSTQAAAVGRAVKDAMQRVFLETNGRIPYGPDLVKRGLQEARSFVKASNMVPVGRELPPQVADVFSIGGRVPSGGQVAFDDKPSKMPNMFKEGTDVAQQWFLENMARHVVNNP